MKDFFSTQKLPTWQHVDCPKPNATDAAWDAARDAARDAAWAAAWDAASDDFQQRVDALFAEGTN